MIIIIVIMTTTIIMGNVSTIPIIAAAYLHVFADALTSVLCDFGPPRWLDLGWTWLDPVMGLVGTVVIAAWSFGLVKSSGAVLLDTVPAPGTRSGDPKPSRESHGDRVSDCHIWRSYPGIVRR